MELYRSVLQMNKNCLSCDQMSIASQLSFVVDQSFFFQSSAFINISGKHQSYLKKSIDK